MRFQTETEYVCLLNHDHMGLATCVRTMATTVRLCPPEACACIPVHCALIVHAHASTGEYNILRISFQPETTTL